MYNEKVREVLITIQLHFLVNILYLKSFLKPKFRKNLRNIVSTILYKKAYFHHAGLNHSKLVINTQQLGLVYTKKSPRESTTEEVSRFSWIFPRESKVGIRLYSVIKLIVTRKRTAKEVSFEWSPRIILSTDSKVHVICI